MFIRLVYRAPGHERRYGVQCFCSGAFGGISESPVCIFGGNPRRPPLAAAPVCTKPARAIAMMDQQRLHEIESHCTQESPPRCRVACPFDLDVRAFMARIAEGKQGEARKVLERHLPLYRISGRHLYQPPWSQSFTTYQGNHWKCMRKPHRHSPRFASWLQLLFLP